MAPLSTPISVLYEATRHVSDLHQVTYVDKPLYPSPHHDIRATEIITHSIDLLIIFPN